MNTWQLCTILPATGVVILDLRVTYSEGQSTPSQSPSQLEVARSL